MDEMGDDPEWRIGKYLEGGGHGPVQGNLLEITWTDW
jgi:hypothetical protein